ncbi:MAG TPA: antibiotic biosynthesis monooxygenase [Flavitalea sp.]|jgi:heme-degrading monooxygenase HmoA|nr:antibiotic biosynthesis monooxygenase [Flavitalea sp.]
MITRIWHGKTKTEFAAVYRQYVIDTGIKDYINTPGNLGAQIWQKEDGEVTDIWTISWWDSYDSIKLFAGEEFEKAHYYGEGEKYLLEREPRVIHCETYHFPAR